VARITAAVLIHEAGGGRWADRIGHDLAGWLMMPLALGLLWVELKFFAMVFVDVEMPQGAKRFGPGPWSPPTRTEPPRRSGDRAAPLARAAAGD
jgi:hypothetical protein